MPPFYPGRNVYQKLMLHRRKDTAALSKRNAEKDPEPPDEEQQEGDGDNE